MLNHRAARLELDEAVLWCEDRRSFLLQPLCDQPPRTQCRPSGKNISEMHEIELLTEFRRRAEDALPGRISRMVLFGSRARGNAGPDSDWDVAVFVNGDVSTWDTLRLADAAYELIIDSGQFIQPVALPDGEAMKSDPLLERIKAEGREL